MTAETKQPWQMSGQDKAYLDPLLDALTFVSKWHGNPVAPDELANPGNRIATSHSNYITSSLALYSGGTNT